MSRHLTETQKLFLQCIGKGYVPSDLRKASRGNHSLHRGRISKSVGLPCEANWIRICYLKKIPLLAPAFATSGIVLPPRLVNALWSTYWFGDLTKAASWICLTRKELRGRLAECRAALGCDTNEQCILVAIEREWFMPSTRPPVMNPSTMYEPDGEIVRIVKR